MDIASNDYIFKKVEELKKLYENKLADESTYVVL